MSELAKLITTVEEHAIDDHIGHHGWGRIAKKLLKWLYYYIARCDLWKRVATKYWRKDYYDVNRMDLEELDVVATRRKELLRRSKDYLDDWLETNTAKDNDDLIQLLEELADEDSEGGISHAVGGEG